MAQITDEKTERFNRAARLATDIIEVAGDGRTARAYFYTPGAISSTLNLSRKREGMWMWERYGIEYAKDEDGNWKLFTIQDCP